MSKKKVSAFAVMHAMAERKMNIHSFPANNIKRMQTGKNGWGEITIAVSNDMITPIATGKSLVSLYIADAEEYGRVGEELLAKEGE